MDKNIFFTMSPPVRRVEEVNKMLQKYELREVADKIGVPYSTFTKEMRTGDYFYHQSDKRYYPFVRSEADRVKIEGNQDKPEISFLKENLETLRTVIDLYNRKSLLLLDDRIYSKNTKFTNKSIRMNNDIYDEFGMFCEEEYPQYKMQDLIAQALLELMNTYKR